jgi:hypothetical protein
MAAALTADCALPSSAFSRSIFSAKSRRSLSNEKRVYTFQQMAAALITDCALPSSAFSRSIFSAKSRRSLSNEKRVYTFPTNGSCPNN